jgi:O-antigen ligase
MSEIAQTHPSDQRAPGALALVLIGLAWAIPIGSLAFESTRLAVVVLGALAGVVALAWLLAARAEQVAPVLLAFFFLVLTVPIDKYFVYQEHVGGWPGLRISAADVFLLALAPIAAVLWLLKRGRDAVPRRLIVLVALLVGQYLVSTAFSSDPKLSLFEIAATIHSLLVAILVATLFRPRLARWVIYALALQVLVHTAFALAQVATGRPIVDGLLGGRAAVLVETLASGERLRPSGLFMHPIVYADFLFLSLPFVAVGIAIETRRLGRLFLAGILLMGLAGLALTLSRGAWLASGVAGVVLFVLALREGIVDRRTLRHIALAALIVGLAGAAVFGPRMWQRLTQSDSGNVDVRFDLNQIALRMIGDRPLTGQGLNTFVETMESFDPKDVKSYFPAPAHNLYLLEASEAGLPALLLLVTVLGFVVVNPLRRMRRLPDVALRAIVAASVAGICGLAISQLADFSFRLEPLRTFIWASIGLCFGALYAGEAALRRSRAAPDASPRPDRPN